MALPPSLLATFLSRERAEEPCSRVPCYDALLVLSREQWSQLLTSELFRDFVAWWKIASMLSFSLSFSFLYLCPSQSLSNCPSVSLSLSLSLCLSLPPSPQPPFLFFCLFVSLSLFFPSPVFLLNSILQILQPPGDPGSKLPIVSRLRDNWHTLSRFVLV